MSVFSDSVKIRDIINSSNQGLIALVTCNVLGPINAFNSMIPGGYGFDFVIF